MGAWDGGSTWDWRKTRTRVLMRDGYRCQLKLNGCLSTATQVHHTIGKAKTGDDPRYLVAACQPCNRAVGEVKSDPLPRGGTRW